MWKSFSSAKQYVRPRKKSTFQASTIKSVRSCGQNVAANLLQWQVAHSWGYTNHHGNEEHQGFRSNVLVPNLGPQIDSSAPTCPCSGICIGIFQGDAGTITCSVTRACLGFTCYCCFGDLPWDLSCAFHFKWNGLVMFLNHFSGELISRIQFENINLLTSGDKLQVVWPQHLLFWWIWSSLALSGAAGVISKAFHFLTHHIREVNARISCSALVLRGH